MPPSSSRSSAVAPLQLHWTYAATKSARKSPSEPLDDKFWSPFGLLEPIDVSWPLGSAMFSQTNRPQMGRSLSMKLGSSSRASVPQIVHRGGRVVGWASCRQLQSTRAPSRGPHLIHRADTEHRSPIRSPASQQISWLVLCPANKIASPPSGQVRALQT